jgi:hypothetical protein
VGRAAASVQAPSPRTWTRDGWSLLQKVVGLVEFWANYLYFSSFFFSKTLVIYLFTAIFSDDDERWIVAMFVVQRERRSMELIGLGLI